MKYSIKPILPVFALLIFCGEVLAQCPYATPTDSGIVVNPSATPQYSSNIGAGQYFSMNIVGGETYTVSTCGLANWDTQLTLYSSGGAYLGYNDDACGDVRSEVSFVASFTGQVRVILNEYDCVASPKVSRVYYGTEPPPPPVLDTDNDGIFDDVDLDDDNDGILDVVECSDLAPLTQNAMFDPTSNYEGAFPGPGIPIAYKTGVDGVSKYADGDNGPTALNFMGWSRPNDRSVDWSEGQYIYGSNQRAHAETPAMVQQSPLGGGFLVVSANQEGFRQDFNVETGRTYKAELWLGILPTYFRNNLDYDGNPGIDPEAGQINTYNGEVRVGVIDGGQVLPGFTTLGTQIDASGNPDSSSPYVSYDIETDFATTYTLSDFPSSLPAYEPSEVYTSYPTLDPHWTKIEIEFKATGTTAAIQLEINPGGAAVIVADGFMVNSTLVLCDTDNDSIPEHLDLDSDNDGIYDAYEAGHGKANINGVLTGTTGSDGIPDSIQNTPDDGTANYAVSDSDGDGTIDSLELDAENDSCSDVVEAGFTDSNNDDILGPNPVIVDANGLVTSATDGYTVPSDSNNNGIYDFQEVGAESMITTNPLNTTICPGCNGSFKVIASSADTYQWQLFNGSAWEDLIDSGVHSGTTTDSLVITGAKPSKTLKLYRVIVSNSSYSCDTAKFSDPASLTIRVRTVITNRRVTYRVKKS